MKGLQHRKGVQKWVAILAIIVLVTVVTVLQTYSSLRFSRSISSTHLYPKKIICNKTYNNVYMTASSDVMTPSFIRKYLEINPRDQEKKMQDNVVTQSTAGYSTGLKEKTFPPKKESKQKITHIGFLKVHKAGSTTMQNIFFRFGLKHNLTFVLPERGHYFLATKAAMPVAPGHHRDILACHSKYSRQLFGSVLPKDTVNIGIIREPLDRMISAAYYYRDVWRSPLLINVPRLNFIHNLVNRPDLYELKPFTRTKNAMGQNFGFSQSVTLNDTTVIKDHLEMLKNDFKLVLVMEKFDESLILMKRTLNWDLFDVVYLKSNSHAHQPVLLNQTELNKFKNTCFLDYAVFETFKDTFDKILSVEGCDFKQEVEYFKSVLDLVKDYCGTKGEYYQRKSLNIAKSEWNEPFEFTKTDCHCMQMKELPFVEFLKRRHRETNILNGLEINDDISGREIKPRKRPRP